MRPLGAPASLSNTDRNWTEPIDQVLQRIRGIGIVQLELDPQATPPPPEQAPVRGCAYCSFKGWIVYEWTRRDGNHAAIPCPECRGPELRQHALDMIFGASGAPKEYNRTTFDSYDLLPIHQQVYTLTDGTTVEGTQEKALAEARAFAAASQGSIIFYGEQFGVGKTALAVAAAREIVHRTACSFVFITTIRLLDRIRSTYGAQSPLRSDEVLSAVLNADLLVLDDLGREYRKPGDAGAWVVERLFDIVDWRHTQHLRTIYTSNKSIPDLEVHLDGATAWRIKDHCDPHLVRVQGCNLRGIPRAEREKVLA